MFDNRIIIAISGKKYTGKDSIAARLVDKWGFWKLSLADPLKEAAKYIFLLSDQQLNGNQKEVVDPRWGLTPREILQRLAHEGIESQFPNVWSTSMQLRIQALPESINKIVIPDIRHMNQYLVARNDWKVNLWRVNRKVPSNKFSNHPGETDLDHLVVWDALLDNNSSLQELYKLVDQHIKSVLNPVGKLYDNNRRKTKSS